MSRVILKTKQTKLRAVELFCGIGGFRIACDSLGIETIWANDLSDQSCDVYRSAFSLSNVHCGDIRELKASIPSHDILTGGFPCQPFSSAGKKQGIRDPRGTLFAEIVSIVSQHHPRFFVLENVKRLLSMDNGEHFGTILDAFSDLGYFIEWRLLNASHLGLPQNRERIIITGVKTSKEEMPKVKLATHEDLVGGMDGMFGELIDRTRWKSISSHGRRFPDWGVAFEGRFFARDLPLFSAAVQMPTLRSLLETQVDAEFFMDESTKRRIAESQFVDRYVSGVQILYNQSGGARMGYTVFGVDGLAPTLTASHSRHYERYAIDGRYRRLTNIEYARLQGFPDQHCKGVSVFNQYGLYGNAVPPPLVRWVIDRITDEAVGCSTDDMLAPPSFGQFSLAI